eukprot:866683_1
MSAADVLRLYHERFNCLPRTPNQLMSFSRQVPHIPNLKWIEARAIMNNNKWNPRHSCHSRHSRQSNKHKKSKRRDSIKKTLKSHRKSFKQHRQSFKQHRLSSTISNKHSMGNSNSNHSAQSVPP